VRLVDADEFLERLFDRDCDIVPQYSEDGYSIERIEETLDATPTVNAVSVVYCQNCKYVHYVCNGERAVPCCDIWEKKIRLSGFCYMGEWRNEID
jgi:hypothetical protein